MVKTIKVTIMKEYLITYNQTIRRRNGDFDLTIFADSLAECKSKMKKEHNLNPFYFRINGVGHDDD